MEADAVTLPLFLMLVSLAGAALSWILVALILLRLRHCRQLDDLLQLIVTEAYLNRHLPIWTAWSAMSGLHFKIDMVDANNINHQ